jgi:hypothetical protein
MDAGFQYAIIVVWRAVGKKMRDVAHTQSFLQSRINLYWPAAVAVGFFAPHLLPVAAGLAQPVLSR